MIPLYRTPKMEQAVNTLAKHFRQVVVDTTYWCIPAIRFRPDMIHAASVYFARVPSQIVLWQNRGGVLIRWNRKTEIGSYDAILFAECPRSVEYLDRYSSGARSIVVVYEPPTWRVHAQSVQKCFLQKSEHKRQTANFAFERMKQLHDASERLTPASLARLLLVHQGQIVPPSSAPVLPSDAEHVSHTHRQAP